MSSRPNKEDVHAYKAIADELREQIRAGKYAPGAMLPKEQDLREMFGVSRSTVRRALATLAESGWAELLPSRGVAAKIGGELEELRGNVAYIDHGSLINERVFFGLSNALQSTGLHLIHVDSMHRGLEGAAEYAADNEFVAAFVWSKTGYPDLARMRAVQERMPLIALDHRIGALATDLISEDNFGGAYEAVRHLARRGCRRIAVSGMMDMLEINHERFSGFLKAQFDSELEPHATDFLFTVTSGVGLAETRVLERRLQDEDRPDGIFVLQDMCVARVVEAVFSAGLRVPEDIAVAAFGGEMPVQIDQVGLTTMVVDWPKFVDECVRVLEHRLRMPREPLIYSVLPTSLVVRGSCGAPPEQWNPLPVQGIETRFGSRWSIQQEYLQIRSDAVRQQLVNSN